MAVTFEEDSGSPKERRDRTSFHATRTGKILWSMRDAFIDEHMLPFPQQYPFTSKYLATVRSIQFAPYGKDLPSGDSSKQSYPNAQVTIQYSTPSVTDQLQQDPVTERIDAFTKHIPLDHKQFQWGAGTGKPVVSRREAPTRVIRGFHYTKTFRAVAQLPETLLTYIDCVNSVAVVPTSVGFENLVFLKETLLFNAPQITRTVDRFGEVAVQLSYKFTCLQNWDIVDHENPPEDPTALGWNAWFRAETQNFEHMYRLDETDTDKYFRPHPAKNFLDIFS